jgi:transcriptional regulator with XRE-family HTH domain
MNRRKSRPANRLAKWALANGYTVTSLARRLNVTRRTAYDLCHGLRPDMLVSTATRILILTGLQPHEYVPGSKLLKIKIT